MSPCSVLATSRKRYCTVQSTETKKFSYTAHYLITHETEQRLRDIHRPRTLQGNIFKTQTWRTNNKGIQETVNVSMTDTREPGCWSILHHFCCTSSKISSAGRPDTEHRWSCSKSAKLLTVGDMHSLPWTGNRYHMSWFHSRKKLSWSVRDPTLKILQLVEGSSHVRPKQGTLWGAQHKESSMSGAHSSGTDGAASEVSTTRLDLTLRANPSQSLWARPHAAKYWSCTWVTLTSSNNKPFTIARATIMKLVNLHSEIREL
jgi:hypothetical protein